MSAEQSMKTVQLITAIRAGDIPARIGYLVGLDRPALLAPDPAALMAARRPDEILARGHRWRVVSELLWHDLLELGRERPEQQAYVIEVDTIEAWLDQPDALPEIDADGWRGNQGNVLVLPVIVNDDGRCSPR